MLLLAAGQLSGVKRFVSCWMNNTVYTRDSDADSSPLPSSSVSSYAWASATLDLHESLMQSLLLHRPGDVLLL